MYARIATFESDPSNVDDAIGMVRADEALNAMNPGGTERRTSVESTRCRFRQSPDGRLSVHLPGASTRYSVAQATSRLAGSAGLGHLHHPLSGRPSGEERVDVVESDAERKRVPLILQRQSHIL